MTAALFCSLGACHREIHCTEAKPYDLAVGRCRVPPILFGGHDNPESTFTHWHRYQMESTSTSDFAVTELVSKLHTLGKVLVNTGHFQEGENVTREEENPTRKKEKH